MNAGNYLDTGRKVAADNWYLSVPLCEYLHNRRTGITGTARSNRCPKELRNIKLDKGQSACVIKGGVYATKWEDKRSVYMLSTGKGYSKK